MVERDEHPAGSEAGADSATGPGGFGASSAEGRPDGSGNDPAPPDGPGDGPVDGTADAPADGIVSVRGGLVGLGFIWLTAVSAFGAMGAAAYGVTTSGGYLVVALVAAALSVAAGSASLRAFGYR